jgi:hypothetical protein
MAQYIRTSIRDFALANAAYIGAQVAFYVPDPTGAPTTELAILYADLTGTDLLPNPQTLDSRGKFPQPVYIEQPVIGTVTISEGSHSTGIITPPLLPDQIAQTQQASEDAAAFYALSVNAAAAAAASAAGAAAAVPGSYLYLRDNYA